MGTRISFYKDYSGGVLEGELEEDKARGQRAIGNHYSIQKINGAQGKEIALEIKERQKTEILQR